MFIYLYLNTSNVINKLIPIVKDDEIVEKFKYIKCY